MRILLSFIFEDRQFQLSPLDQALATLRFMEDVVGIDRNKTVIALLAFSHEYFEKHMLKKQRPFELKKLSQNLYVAKLPYAVRTKCPHLRWIKLQRWHPWQMLSDLLDELGSNDSLVHFYRPTKIYSPLHFYWNENMLLDCPYVLASHIRNVIVTPDNDANLPITTIKWEEQNHFNLEPTSYYKSSFQLLFVQPIIANLIATGKTNSYEILQSLANKHTKEVPGYTNIEIFYPKSLRDKLYPNRPRNTRNYYTLQIKVDSNFLDASKCYPKQAVVDLDELIRQIAKHKPYYPNPILTLRARVLCLGPRHHN